MTTFVTGVAGFIGYHVAQHLLGRGERVIGIDNLNSYYDPRLKEDRLAGLRRAAPDAFEFHKLDFAASEGLERVLERLEFDRIIHLGAQAGVRYSLENPRAYISANIMGHLNLLEVARHRKVRHFVYASSSSVYGSNSALPFRVTDRTDHPISLYAATKKADELMSEAYAHLYRIPTTGLRFFTVYGPWGRPDMAMWIFTRKIMAGEPIQLFNRGKMRRDFTYVDDIVSGVVAASDNPPPEPPPAGGPPHRIYNIGNSHAEDLMRVVSLVEEACGRRAIVEMLDMQSGDVPETYADIDAIRTDLGFEPSTPVDIGVPRFVDWFNDYHQRT
jgi:UDP-glucuronate 4-epimerase